MFLVYANSGLLHSYHYKMSFLPPIRPLVSNLLFRILTMVNWYFKDLKLKTKYNTANTMPGTWNTFSKQNIFIFCLLSHLPKL